MNSSRANNLCMSQIRLIRKRLGLSQASMADAMGCSQSNVSFYEKGQTVPPETAKKLLSFAALKGLCITYDHVYGNAELPEPAEAASTASEAGHE